MSLSITVVQQTEFDAQVKAEYQAMGKRLPETIRNRNGFTGRFVEFRTVGKVISQPLGYQDAVTPQDPGYDRVILTVNKFVTPTVTDELQEVTVNFSDKQENAQLIAWAVRRRQDQLVIDALAAALLPAGNVIPVDFPNPPGTDTGMTFDKLNEIVRLFSKNNVPHGPEVRHILMDSSSESNLLNEPKFTNNEFVNKGAIKTGTLDGSVVMGMTIHVIGDMAEGGLPFEDPGPNTIRRNFAYHRLAAGFGMNKFGTEINYLPTLTSWLVNGIHQSGAVVIDPVGVIDIQTLVNT